MKSPLRIGILLGHSIEVPVPEAAEMAKAVVDALRQSELALEIHVDAASKESLRRLAKVGCDILMYCGHGMEEGQLVFVDGPQTFDDVSSRSGLGEFWRQLKGVMLFACFSGKFAPSLSCPWLAFDEEIQRLAPKGFLHAWVRALKTLPLREALLEAHGLKLRGVPVFFGNSLA